jgi:ribokinase
MFAMPSVQSRRPLVLVVGDANPDLVLRGDVLPRFGQAEQLLDAADLLVGGSAAITAHGFARLARPVALLAAVGKDALAGPLLAELAAAGVQLDQIIERSDQTTGLTVVLSRPADRAMLTHLGAIPSLTGQDVRVAVCAARGRGLCHVHVSSLFLQPSLARDLPAVLAEVRAGGATVSLDTNDDPARRWEGAGALLPHVDVLLPNEAEAAGLAAAVTGAPAADAGAAALALAERGPLVVVKRGDEGALAALPDGTVLTAGPVPVDAVDTTGAGDTFDAAFLDAWLDAEPLERCLARAAMAGAAAVRAVGGTAGQPTPSELTLPEGTA